MRFGHPFRTSSTDVSLLSLYLYNIGCASAIFAYKSARLPSAFTIFAKTSRTFRRVDLPEQRYYLDKISQGDRQAFEALYMYYYAPLVRIARRFTPAATAEDIVQDIFYKLWRTPLTFSSMEAFRSYLYNSVRNMCLNYLRDMGNKSRHADNIRSQAYYEAVMDEEVFLHLTRAIESLPENYRLTLEYVLEGHTAEEIAEKMNTTVDAVKGYKKRGKKLLKDRLGDNLSFLLLFI